MPAVSVVVPIYGAQSYLAACLDSLKEQEFSDFEVLCVIDGSPDDSARIARRYELEDPRFRVFDKENGGVSSARNYGLDHALGDIVMFVDADDTVLPGFCGRVYQAFKQTGADVVRFGAYAESPRESAGWYERVLSPGNAVYDSFCPELAFTGLFSPFVWHMAIRREYLDRAGLRFDEHIAFGEDATFVMAVLARLGRYSTIQDKLYRYRASSHDSFMDSYGADAARRFAAHLDVVSAVFEDWCSVGMFQAYAHELFHWSQDYLLNRVEQLSDEKRAEHLDKVNQLWATYFDWVGFEPMRVEVSCVCRGDGKFYAKCKVTAVLPIRRIECTASVDGVSVPAGVYPCANESDTSAQWWVLVLPLIDARAINVALVPDGRSYEQATEEFSYRKVKWLSRLNYRLNPRECAEIRDFERSFTSLSYGVELIERFEAGEEAVWRLAVKWSGAPQSIPSLQVADGRGHVLNAHVYFFEFQEADVLSGVDEHALFQSVKLPASCDSFIVIACPPREEQDIQEGFAVMCPDQARGMRERKRDAMLSAGDDDGRYRRWLEERRAKPGDVMRQRQAAHEMTVVFDLVVLPGEDGIEALESTIASVVSQSYGRWTLYVLSEVGQPCGEFIHDDRVVYLPEGESISGAALGRMKGDFVAFVWCGDRLEPDALYSFARAIESSLQEGDLPDVFYCDEDQVLEDGGFGAPLFKSRFNWDMQYCWNWVGNLLVVKRDLVKSFGDAAPNSWRAWHYRCTLRAIEQGARFSYVPRVLYHALCSPLSGVPLSELKSVLRDHLMRRDLDCRVVDGPLNGSMRVRYCIPEPHPLVSIIIPSKDHVDVLEACVRSIVEKSTYDAFEIIIVENNSTDPKTFDYYAEVERIYPSVRVIVWPDEFNYSKIVNFGVSHARGEYLLLLNNDTEVIAESFIEEMIGCLQRDEVGVVGAKLLFRDGLVQHSGMGVAVWNAVVHTNQNRMVDDGGYQGRACLPGQYSSVTGACQMVRTEVFRKVGGYDERFAVGFNDVDFCLRLQKAGYLVVFTPYALLYHYEFTSRGREVADHAKMMRWKKEQALLMREWPRIFVDGDPYTSPNLERDNTHYRLT